MAAAAVPAAAVAPNLYTPWVPVGATKPGLTGVEGGFAVDGVRVVVLVDNHRDPEGRCVPAWGLSVYVEAGGSAVLFDAGPDPGVLAYNAEVLGVDLAKLDAIVVSHEHRDHVEGLGAVAGVGSSTPVYVPAGMSPYARRRIEGLGFGRVVEVGGTTVVAPGMAVVGPLYGPPYEQALAVNLADRGLVLIVGCSHPGVVSIVRRASRDLGAKPYAVIGGLHLPATLSTVRSVMVELKRLGVRVVVPVHCSGGTAAELASELFGFDRSREGHVCCSVVLGGGG